MRRVTADDFDQEITRVDVAPPASEEDYNLAEVNPEAIPREDLNRLREDWIAARENGDPLYVISDQGYIFYVSVGGDGKALTVHPVIPRYEIQEGGVLQYAGPTAFLSLEETLGRYQVVPMSHIADSNVAAHVATVRNPIWFRAVQRLIAQHPRKQDNPYKNE